MRPLFELTLNRFRRLVVPVFPQRLSTFVQQVAQLLRSLCHCNTSRQMTTFAAYRLHFFLRSIPLASSLEARIFLGAYSVVTVTFSLCPMTLYSTNIDRHVL